ncbi:hypothetical protein RSA36_22175, partial [Pantoea stewartii]
RGELQGAELHGLVDRDLEIDDPAGDLVEPGEHRGRVLDLVGSGGAGADEEREARGERAACEGGDAAQGSDP